MTTALPAEHWRRRDTRVSASRALASTTRASIYEHLCADPDAYTVRDVAERFDLHPNVARTHLEMLADAGLLVVGRRKHPGGGRPAKVYRAGDGDDTDAARPSVGDQAAARLQIKLLAELVRGNGDRDVETRALQVGAAEGRRLVEPLADEGADEAEGIGAAAALVARGLRPHIADVRVVKEEHDWADLAGLAATFELLAASQAGLAEALQRGLVEGAFAGAGCRVTVAGAGALPDGDRVWRARPARGASVARSGPPAARRVDARGMAREQGVVRAMRAVTELASGQVLEVFAEGPGSPAAFARWVDRAGHELLGVERAVDEAGRPAIRLLIRKGRG